MTQAPTPKFRDLSTAECEAILARNHVGRIAFAFKDRVDIEPIGYAFANGVINWRTSEGTKLDVLRRQPSVAFEVDEVEGPFDWHSVVVHGTVYQVEPAGSEHDRRVWEEALAALRAVQPAAFGPEDPAPFRTTVLQLHIMEISGREARTR